MARVNWAPGSGGILLDGRHTNMEEANLAVARRLL
jgi:hypothetical protein